MSVHRTWLSSVVDDWLMVEDWACPLCVLRYFAHVKELTQHMILHHDEWVAGRRQVFAPCSISANDAIDGTLLDW